MTDPEGRETEDPLASELRRLSRENLPRFGSFGEYVFVAVAKALGKTAVPRHESRIDFLVDGAPVDVKSTARWIDVACPVSCARWAGRRRPEVLYALVELFREGARVSLEGEPWGSVVPWPELATSYARWADDHRPEAPAKTASATRKAAAPVTQEAEGICRGNGWKPHVTYRTCQRGFGLHNPPDFTKRRGEGVVHVFISFEDENVARDRIVTIYAIPDQDVGSLPRHPPGPLSKGVPRIDLRALTPRYVYRDLDDFRDRFFRLHGLGDAA